MKKKTKIIIIIAVVLIILVLAGILGWKIYQDKKNMENIPVQNNEEQIVSNTTQKETQKEKQVEIYNGDDRPIAVMIDNHKGAWPQAGLNDAYLVYEIVVEGGETRLMALFKGKDLENIGPIRSSRHYFLDYAMENDAIYTHYGWSPQAKSDISKYSVNNINGIFFSTSDFKRIKGKNSPHNVMTSTSSILKIAEKNGYRTTSKQESVLKYSTNEIKLDDGIDATSVTIPHSTLQKVKYEYDEQTNRYTRYARGVVQKDYTTKKNITTKNIIIEFVDNSTLSDGSGKGRQTLSNIGTFNGYYITNGKAEKITCTKNARDSKTVYKNSKGEIIKVNDGNTWINICPKNANVVIE